MKIIYTSPLPYYVGFWCNKYGSFLANGHMFNFLSQLNSDKVMALPYGDGLVEEEAMNNSKDYSGHSEDVLLGVHCYRNVKTIKNKLICLPLDDDIFKYGLREVVQRDAPNLDLPWEQKLPIVYFRGTGNMHSFHNPRHLVVKQLYNDPRCNVKFIRTISTEQRDWDSPYFDQRTNGWYQPVPLSEFVQHKYVMIIDNCLISAGLQVNFGLGSVPILINHPDTVFWFKDLLIPYHNYVPVKYDLSNLDETIDWLINHDEEAKQIAVNAREFANKVFSSEYQQQYIIDAINQ